MMIKTILLTLTLVLTTLSCAQAADIAAGKKKAANCAGCHGENGIATSPMYPNLAGQQPAFTEKVLKEYKSGARPSYMMQSVLGRLNEKDFADIAAYYHSLK